MPHSETPNYLSYKYTNTHSSPTISYHFRPLPLSHQHTIRLHELWPPWKEVEIEVVRIKIKYVVQESRPDREKILKEIKQEEGEKD